MWRINYGNGQVSGGLKPLKAAKAELIKEPDFSLMWIEYYEAGSADEPGEWVLKFRGRDLELG